VVTKGVHFRFNPWEGKVEEVDDVAIAELFDEAEFFCAREEEALHEAICHVADDASDDANPCDFEEACIEESALQQDDKPDECAELDAEEEDGRPSGAIPKAKGDACVMDAQDVEVHDAFPIKYIGEVRDVVANGGAVVEDDVPFADLVEDVEDGDAGNHP